MSPKKSRQEQLTVHLYSFGYKYSGVPPDDGGHGGGFVFDCRCLPNPHWEDDLRDRGGDEDVVAAWMEQQPGVNDFAAHVEALVMHAARRYEETERTRLMVSCGCTGGRHRSVYMAERLARVLGWVGVKVVLTHLDLKRKPAASS